MKGLMPSPCASQVAPAFGHEELQIHALGVAVGHAGHVVGDGPDELQPVGRRVAGCGRRRRQSLGMLEEVLHELGEQLLAPSARRPPPETRAYTVWNRKVRSSSIALPTSGVCTMIAALVAAVDQVVHQRVDAVAARLAQQARPGLGGRSAGVMRPARRASSMSWLM